MTGGGDLFIMERSDVMKSKYYVTWEEYKEKHPELKGKLEKVIAPKIEKYEDMMFNFIIGLLL